MTEHVRLVVAPTDARWFSYLAECNAETPLEDVNFWQPPSRKTQRPIGFRSLGRGEWFLFLVRDGNGPRKIGGGGRFVAFHEFPCSVAWNAFGSNNGAKNLDSMKKSIARARGERVGIKGDFTIGCRVLAEPVFLPREAWFDPPGWSSNIMSHKAYSTEDAQGMLLEHLFLDACKSAWPEQAERFGAGQVIHPRLGQGSFRTEIARVYGRCALTRERTLVVLEAAHIRPYSREGKHEISNGLLLRSDLHRLFDRGYGTVEATRDKYRFVFSNRIREEFGNGREYYGMDGSELLLPDDPKDYPSREQLQWHNENVFQG